MKFYSVFERRDASAWEFEILGELMFLPKVAYRRCGHVWAGFDPVPIELSHLVEVAEFLQPAGTANVVTPDQWQVIRVAIETEFRTQKYAVPVIDPGVRAGPLSISIESGGTAMDYMSFAGMAIWSHGLVDQFRAHGVTGFEGYAVNVALHNSSKTNPPPLYFELLTLAEVPLAPMADLSIERCAACGTLLNVSYSGLIVDERTWDGADFVRICDVGAIVVSERVKSVAERFGAKGLQFLPSERIAVGRHQVDIAELIAELEFERQMQGRREGPV